MFGYVKTGMTTWLVLMMMMMTSLCWTPSVQAVSSCSSVAEVFRTRLASPADHVPVQPIPGRPGSTCSSSLVHTSGLSCCTPDIEARFQPTSLDYLREHIRASNSQLRARIKHSLHLFQEHLRQSAGEAYNRTCDTLSTLYRIPRQVQAGVVDSFFRRLVSFLPGSGQLRLHNIVADLFIDLFPLLFDYVLSDPSRPQPGGPELHRCLVQHYHDIQPFGTLPHQLEARVRHGFQRAKVHLDALTVLLSTIDASDQVQVADHCLQAVSRLQLCPLCSGLIQTRPCRGLCLNVMRGCLSGISEISSAWDDLVMDYENLHMGMFQKNNAQDLLTHLHGNISEAFLQAMTDGPRIFARVMELCNETSRTNSGAGLAPRKHLVPEQLPVQLASERTHYLHKDSERTHYLHKDSERTHSLRKDMSSLIAQLEESKGFLQRLADGLCRNSTIYDQEMTSDQCWNGSAIGRYMREVPEVNVISQAKNNVEVKVTLIPEPVLMKVKDALVHMKRNVSSLQNQELMLGDQSYLRLEGSGTGRDVTIDDEDYVERNSGSGSGRGSDDDTEGEEDEEGVKRIGDKTTYTVRPTGSDIGRGHSVPSGGGAGGPGVRPGGDKGGRGPKSSTSVLLVSWPATCLCVIVTSCLLLWRTN